MNENKKKSRKMVYTREQHIPIGEAVLNVTDKTIIDNIQKIM